MEKLHEIKLEYDNLYKMMISPDNQNAVLALSLLETVDFKNNLVPILLLYKKTSISSEYWKEHAPKLWAKLKKHGVSSDNPLTYKQILEIIKDKKVSEDQVNIFIQSVNDTLKNHLCDYGYDFIEKIEIKLKHKIYE